jgi:predicted nuclease with TOPRIM domain
MAAMVNLTDRVKRLVGTFTHKKFAEEIEEVQRIVESLQAEHATLREQNRKLMAENAELKDAIAALEQDAAPSAERTSQQVDDLDEISEKILIDISNNETPKDSIISYFQLTKAKGDRYFEILESRNLIRVKYTLDDDVYFVVTPEGRDYLESS